MRAFILCLFLFITCILQAQTYPVNQSVGNTPATLVTTNSIRANQGVILGSFADTAAANLLPYLKNYPGAMIYTTGDGSIWVRNPMASGWIDIGGGITPSGSFWKVGGNFFPVAAPTRNIGTLQPYGGAIGLMTNSNVHLILSDTGLFRNQSVDDSVLVKNTLGEFGVYPKSAFSGSTYTFPYSVVAPGDAIQLENDTSTTVANYFYGTNSAGRRTWLPQSGIVGVTPTWQQTLTAGSALTEDNSVDLGGFNFEFTGGATTSAVSFSNLSSFGVSTATGSVITANPVIGSTGETSFTSGLRISRSSNMKLLPDSLYINPSSGNLFIDSLTNLSTQNTLLGWKQGTGQGQVGYVTLGSGLSLSSGVLNTSATGGGSISDTMVWKLLGNDLNAMANDVDARLGTKSPHPLRIMTNDTVRAIIPDDGLRINNHDSIVIVGIDTVSKNLYLKTTGGGSSYTFPYSVIAPGNAIQLENDTAATVSNYFYGTNIAGRKGWYSQSALRPYTFTNGLTESGGSVKLGGTLVDATTTINADGNNLEITGGAQIEFLAQDGGNVVAATPNRSSITVGDDVIIAPYLSSLIIDSLAYTLSTVGKKIMLRDTATGLVENIDPALIGGGGGIASGEQGQIYQTSNGAAAWKYDTTTLVTFSAGARFVTDTTLFTDSTLYGSFYLDGNDTLVITGLKAVMQGGTSDTLGIQVTYNDSINVTGSNMFTATLPINSTTTGTSPDADDWTGGAAPFKIPPGNWVWLKSPTVVAGRKPYYLSVSIIGYKKRVN